MEIFRALGGGVTTDSAFSDVRHHLGPDRAGNLLEVVTVVRDDSTEIVIHAMAMRRAYQSLLPDPGEDDG